MKRNLMNIPKVKFSLVAAFFFIFNSITYAQVIQEYIGKSGIRTSAISSTLLKGSSNRVIVGSKIVAGGNDDAIITCIDASGSLLWTKEVSSSQGDRFLSVVATSDGGCVVAGYVNQNMSSIYWDSQGAVYKFDAFGNLVWKNIFKVTSYGEVFFSVIEVPGSDNIVCAGNTDFGNGASTSGIIVNMSSAGTVNWAKRYNYSTGNEIHGVSYLNGKLVAAGFYRGSSYYDGNVFAVEETDGSIVWNRSFDCSSNIFSGNNTLFVDRVDIVDDKIYMNVQLSSPWGTLPGTRSPSIIYLDTTGLSPECLEYPLTGFSYANCVHSKIVSSSEIYLFQSASNSYWDWMYTNTPISSVSEVFCTKINTTSGPTGGFTKSFSTTGKQTIVSADFINDTLLGVGSSINDPSNLIGVQDLFYFKSDTNMTSGSASCVSDVAGQLFSNPTVSFNPSFTFSSISDAIFLTPVTPVITAITFTAKNPCIFIAPNVISPDFSLLRSSCFTFDFTDLTTTTSSGIKFWKWSFGDGATSGFKNPSHTYSAPGTYTVKLIVTDSSGKSDSVIKTVNFSLDKFAKAGNDTTICAIGGNASLQLNASGGSTYSWSPPTGLSNPAVANPDATISAKQMYIVTIVDTMGCIDRDSIVVNLSMIDVKAKPDTSACLGAKIQLNAQGANSYKWTPPTGLDKDNISNPKLTISESIKIVVSGTDSFGCTDTDTITITVKASTANVDALPTDTSGCVGTEIQLNATGAVSYKWQPPSGLDKDNIANPKLIISGVVRYVVTGTDTSGCTDTDTVTVKGFTLPKVQATSDNTIADCNEKTVLLNATGAETYEWYPAIYCDNSNAASTNVRPPATRVFTVKGVDKNGCTGEDTITVFYEGKSSIRVPNAFTPNNDGINDKIIPIIVCDFTLTEFVIYNRWGEQVFSSQSIGNPWNGTFNGKPCELGVYYYLIKGKNSTDEEVMFKGDITLIR